MHIPIYYPFDVQNNVIEPEFDFEIPENQRDFFSESTFDDEGGSQSATFESSKVFSGEKDTECQVFQNRTQVNRRELSLDRFDSCYRKKCASKCSL